MSPAWRRLLAKHKGKTLVELCRRPKIDERLAGFIIGFSDTLILLHRLNWETFTLDGYTLLRDEDVKNQRFFTRSSYWQNKAIKMFILRPKELTGFALDNWFHALAAISQQFPLVDIECEIAYPGECYIGVPLKMTPKLLILDDLDCNSEWSSPRRFKFDQITRIDFGGGYERALAATAPKRRAKVLKQYGLSLIDRPQSKSWLKALRSMQGLELHRADGKLN